MYQSKNPLGSEGESNRHGVKNLSRSGSTTEHNAGNSSPKLDVSPSGQMKILARGVSYAQILLVSQEKFDPVIEIRRSPWPTS